MLVSKSSTKNHSWWQDISLPPLQTLKFSLISLPMDSHSVSFNLNFTLIKFQRLLRISDHFVLEITKKDTHIRDQASIESFKVLWPKVEISPTTTVQVDAPFMETSLMTKSQACKSSTPREDSFPWLTPAQTQMDLNSSYVSSQPHISMELIAFSATWLMEMMFLIRWKLLEPEVKEPLELSLTLLTVEKSCDQFFMAYDKSYKILSFIIFYKPQIFKRKIINIIIKNYYKY